MVYERPCRFSAEDPDRLWILVAGRALSRPEALRWRRVLSGRRKWWPLASFVLLFVFLINGVAALNDPSRKVFGMASFDIALAVLLMLGAAVAASVGFGKALQCPCKQDLSRFAAYNADAVRHQQGARLAFYGDRLTITTLRGTVVLPFAEVETCVETYDGFALSNGTEWYILRAQDLIAFDADIIRAYLEERLEPHRMRCVSAVRPQLRQPLPIPTFTEAASLAEAELVYEDTTLYKQQRWELLGLFVWVALCLAVFGGVVTAGFVKITPWLWADIGLLCSGAAAVTWLFALCLWVWHRPQKTKQPLTATFYADGLMLEANGASQFCVKERLKLSADNTGVTVHFMNRKTLFIPFEAVENAEILQSLAGVPNTVGQ